MLLAFYRKFVPGYTFSVLRSIRLTFSIPRPYERERAQSGTFGQFFEHYDNTILQYCIEAQSQSLVYVFGIRFLGMILCDLLDIFGRMFEGLFGTLQMVFHTVWDVFMMSLVHDSIIIFCIQGSKGLVWTGKP